MELIINYYYQSPSYFGLMGSLYLLIIFMALWDRDFWRSFGSQLKLKKRLDLYLTAISKEKETIELIAELPKSDELPSFVDMAQLLVKALPLNDRSEAYTLLVTQLLPKKLPARRNLARWEFEVVYEDIILLFQKEPSYDRIKVLKKYLFEAEIKELIRNSLALAMARYLKEHPEATNRVQKRDRDRASQWQAMSISQLEDKASHLLEEVERWEKFAKAKHPDLWEEYKLKSFNALLNLDSAYSGSFHAAMGDFAIFLKSAGASFEELRVH